MSLGFDAISALPFATSGPDSDVNVSVSANQLTITIGSVGIVADAVTETLTANPLTLGFGTLSITGTANVSVTANPLTMGIGTITVTADSNHTVSGNALTLATGNVTVSGTALVRTGWQSANIDYKRAWYNYVERDCSGSKHGLDTNRSKLKLWHQHIHQI